MDIRMASTWLMTLCLVPCMATRDLSNWMTSLDDSTQLSELNIPGTHNTLAFYGGLSIECQSKSLIEQYNMGIRFVEIRCRRYEDSLPIHHGIKFQKQFFTADAVNPTVAWLKEHPGETILMLVQQESYKPIKGTRDFSDMVKGSLDYAGANYITTLPKTIGEARGKIIIFRKDWPSDEPTFGTDMRSLRVHNDWQDHTKTSKWENVKNFLDKVRTTYPRSSLCFTYASGYTTFLKIPNPGSMAKYVNPKLKEYCEEHQQERLGIVVVDFPENVGNIAESIVR